MLTEVRFYSTRYGNQFDHYFRTDYSEFVNTLWASAPAFASRVNLGHTDGVKIINTFEGDFNSVNCAVIDLEDIGKQFYRIVSKRFVRKNIWEIGLVKDVISSNWNKITSSKMVIKRIGLDRTVFNPLLLIPEKFQFNKIKTNQINLSENTHKSWGYMIYCASGSFAESKNIAVDNGSNLDFDESLTTPITQYQYYNANNYERYVNSWDVYINININHLSNKTYHFSKNNGVLSYEESSHSPDAELVIDSIVGYPDLDKTLLNLNKYFTIKSTEGAYNEYNYPEQQENGKIIKCVYLDGSTEITKYYENSSGYATEGFTYLNVNLPTTAEYHSILGVVGSAFNRINDKTSAEVHENITRLTQEFIPTASFTATMGVHNRANDQPMVCLYIPFISGGTVDGSKISQNEIENFLYALSVAGSGENGYVYDIQVVPYCPISGVITNNNINIDSSNIPTNHDIVTTPGGKFIIIECKYTQFSVSIPCPISVSDYKLDAQKEYQITSASGSQSVPISAIMNGGINYFTATCTYRPYASTIRLQPNFKQVYGTNYNDTRGLIIKEDTSITIVSSAWATYCRQNVNYMQSFNSGQDYQSAVLTINQKADWGNFAFDSANRVLESVATGIGAGIIAGPGAAAGVIGAGLGTEGLQAGQLAYNQQIDKELLNTKLDQDRKQLSYTLGNIKAIPQNLSKLSGLTAIFNYVPYIQVFEPSEVEKNLYKTYLDDNGCALGGMGKPVEYSTNPNYLEGSIYLASGAWDVVEYKIVCDELNQGVRLYKEA